MADAALQSPSEPVARSAGSCDSLPSVPVIARAEWTEPDRELLVVGKLSWEQFDGALPGSESVAGGLVVVDAHLYGALAGALLGIVLIAINHRQNAPPNDQQAQKTS